MTKQSNRHLRTLIIHGARAVILGCQKRDDGLGEWLKKLIARCGVMETRPPWPANGFVLPGAF
ncbi:protein of unknown function [Xenorhabdus poinarii G6]|uniref:Transposase n=1 Tax=Xenorhabdus poinarii G6 TaxID=1354304 RepID=A0A068QYB7_9GAMM|nr:protein of unknown function [Xenorhabdus poinarii G6]